jgi:hypothetical protein
MAARSLTLRIGLVLRADEAANEAHIKARANDRTKCLSAA